MKTLQNKPRFTSYLAGMAAFGLVLLMIAPAATKQSGSGATFKLKNLTISSISSQGLEYNPGAAGTSGLAPFKFKGAPRIHAALTDQNLTLDCTKISGKINRSQGSLAEAWLSGSVEAHTVTLPKPGSSDGPQQINLQSESVHYQNKTSYQAVPSTPASLFDFPSQVTLTGASPKDHTDYTMVAGSGTVELGADSSAGSQQLKTAQFKGGVQLQFHHTNVNSEKERVSGPTNLKANADLVEIHRTLEPQSLKAHYIIKLLGHVAIHSESANGNADLENVTGIEITLNGQFEVESWQGIDDATTGTFVPKGSALQLEPSLQSLFQLITRSHDTANSV